MKTILKTALIVLSTSVATMAMMPEDQLLPRMSNIIGGGQQLITMDETKSYERIVPPMPRPSIEDFQRHIEWLENSQKARNTTRDFLNLMINYPHTFISVFEKIAGSNVACDIVEQLQGNRFQRDPSSTEMTDNAAKILSVLDKEYAVVEEEISKLKRHIEKRNSESN